MELGLGFGSERRRGTETVIAVIVSMWRVKRGKTKTWPAGWVESGHDGTGRDLFGLRWK